jgi:hypothetical protein
MAKPKRYTPWELACQTRRAAIVYHMFHDGLQRTVAEATRVQDMKHPELAAEVAAGYRRN